MTRPLEGLCFRADRPYIQAGDIVQSFTALYPERDLCFDFHQPVRGAVMIHDGRSDAGVSVSAAGEKSWTLMAGEGALPRIGYDELAVWAACHYEENSATAQPFAPEHDNRFLFAITILKGLLLRRTKDPGRWLVRRLRVHDLAAWKTAGEVQIRLGLLIDATASQCEVWADGRLCGEITCRFQ